MNTTMVSVFNFGAKLFGRTRPEVEVTYCTHLPNESKFQVECHFTWKLIPKNTEDERRDAEECLKHCYPQDPLDHKTNIHEFYNRTMKGYCHTVLGDFRRAMDYMDEAERKIQEIPQKYVQAFNHIIQGNRYYILLLQGKNEEAVASLKTTKCFHNLNTGQKIAVAVLKGEAKMKTGRREDFSEGMQEVLQCATMDKTEPEWYFLYGKALRRHRQTIRPDSGNYTDEVAYFRRAYDLASVQLSPLLDIYGYHLGKSLLHYCWSKEFYHSRVPFLTTSQQCYSLMSNMSNSPTCTARMLARCADCFMKLPQPRQDLPRALLCLEKAYEIQQWSAIVNYTFGTYYKLKKQLPNALKHFDDAKTCPHKTLACHLGSIAVRMQLGSDIPVIEDICSLLDEYREADSFTLARIYLFRGLFMWYKFCNLAAGFEDIHMAVRLDPKIIREKFKKYCSPPLYTSEEYKTILINLTDRFHEYFLTESNYKEKEIMKSAFSSLSTLLQLEGKPGLKRSWNNQVEETPGISSSSSSVFKRPTLSPLKKLFGVK